MRLAETTSVKPFKYKYYETEENIAYGSEGCGRCDRHGTADYY